MIICKTPNRISLTGGSSDFPAWYKENGGLVVGAAINKYSYHAVRILPEFFDYRSRFVYSEIETVKSDLEIKHRAIKATLQFLGVDLPLEVVHFSDIPSRSGVGSSSTYLVGLLNALYALQGVYRPPEDLSNDAIYIEQDMLKDNVGCQDQTFAAYGGFNIIRFRKSGKIDVEPVVIDQKAIQELESHILLIHTGISRTASEIASSYSPQIKSKRQQNWAIMKLAEEAISSIYEKNWSKLGDIVGESWEIKKQFSNKVTTSVVDDMYQKALSAGAYGGKLCGSGGGGVLLLVAHPDNHLNILQTLGNPLNIPIKFDFSGSKVIFSSGGNT